ncbi:helix-turn-helix transcriptional regulator [Flavobacterium sp. SM15]|uniref:helix-turn-helix domain-containing protein n=1 Tax=Flavobacterium sp. SM15 TaxID=2908005 RepID=UPI001EDC564D|nr:helix-turn-helix transcriptional regulator [Flavobacterium sp. SM15]MCG2611652.1 helix-turn-helix transcriptional regulator [Flavobacterium sp. SM15]
MLKPNNFRQTLGITQEEAAILLKTTKSQIAMFELGLRELPTAKMLKLVTLYNHVKNKQQDKSTVIDLKAETAKSILVVEQELKENELKLLLLNRELESYKAKYQKYSSTLELVAYLENEHPEKEQTSPDFTGILRRKAIKGMEKNGLSVQLKCELALKAAQHYHKELKKELERYK